MKPSQFAQSLKRIASKIEASKNPNRDLVVRDLKNIITAAGQNLFLWTTDSGSFLVRANSRDEAIRRVLTNRTGGESIQDAIRHFNKNDELTEIDGEIFDEPYKGPIDSEWTEEDESKFDKSGGFDPFED